MALVDRRSIQKFFGWKAMPSDESEDVAGMRPITGVNYHVQADAAKC